MDKEKPIIFGAQENDIAKIKERFSDAKIIDSYGQQLEELFFIRNPRYRFDKNYAEDLKKFISEESKGMPLEQCGNWIYFPWNKLLAHYLSDEMHQELRTARNRNLITKEEQKQFYDFNVGIAGLSVGSHAALTLAMMGGGRLMKLADFDLISGSNLNRIRTDFTNVGINKCDIVAHQIWQINPYGEIHSYNKGLTLENLEEFLGGEKKLDVLVECLDNPELKIRLRLEARKLGIPVVMATDNGDNIIFDIERFDLDKNLMLFNGVLGDITLEEFQKFPPQELPKVATKIAGAQVVVPRMLESVLNVGRTLYSWPQLGDAASLAGISTAYVIKRLALRQPLKSGKLEVNLDSVFDPEYFSEEKVKERDEQRKKYLKEIGF